jgi:exopolysaccharide biosynthesis predicted pyruvyltransferase EpsI
MSDNMKKLDIDDYLTQFQKEQFDYIPNPGNAGDSLIAAGTYQTFDKLGLKYNVKNRHRFLHKNKVVVYGGGGNLGNMTNFSAQFISRVHQHAKKLVILPHTIKNIDPLLDAFGTNVDIICREHISYDYVRNSNTRANIYIADDLALKTNVTPLLHKHPSIIDNLQIMIQYITRKSNLSSEQPPTLRAIKQLFNLKTKLQELKNINSTDHLVVFRTDGEKTNQELPHNNIDLSEELTLGVETKELTMINAAIFLQFLNTYTEITTNRLHVAVAGALLNKKVNFYGNNYYKCKAVYDFSLTSKNNIKWVE